MKPRQVKGFGDFLVVLDEAGFSLGGGSSDGVYAIVDRGWADVPPHETPLRWHTGDAETDPWQWRMRVLAERTDIAYGKIFFRKSGYLTKKWVPYFLAVRRGTPASATFVDAYDAGTMSYMAKRVFDVIDESGAMPVHTLKQLVNVAKDEKAAFERALADLQMKMFLTVAGEQQKISKDGEAYGWSSKIFCTTESFWGEEVFAQAAVMDRREAIDAITAQIYTLNPNADAKKVRKFIEG